MTEHLTEVIQSGAFPSRQKSGKQTRYFIRQVLETDENFDSHLVQGTDTNNNSHVLQGLIIYFLGQ